MKILTLIVAIIFVLLVGTAASYDEETGTLHTFHLESAKETSSIARELVRTFLTDPEWKKRADGIRQRFQHWQEEHQEDAGMFLNNQLAAIILAASGGRIERLKDAAVWMAMYEEFEQPLPSYISEFIEKNISSINGLLANFSWKNAGVYVKTKAWQKDGSVKAKER